MKELFPLHVEQFRTLNISKELHNTSIYQEGYEHFHIHKLEEVKAHLITNGEIHRKAIPDFIYLTKGRIKRNINLNSYEIKAPSIFIAQAYSIISNKNLSDDVEGFYCHFSPNFIADTLKTPSVFKEFHFLKSNVNPVLTLNSSDLAFYKSAMNQLHNDYRSKHSNREKILFHQLLTLLFRLKSLWDLPNSNESISIKYEKLLSLHFPEWTTVQEYADALNISANHLNKTVKAETGKSASSFIKETTLLYAKVLLNENEMTPVAAISDYLKFSESSHFIRFFKKQTGKTPRQYRDE